MITTYNYSRITRFSFRLLLENLSICTRAIWMGVCIVGKVWLGMTSVLCALRIARVHKSKDDHRSAILIGVIDGKPHCRARPADVCNGQGNVFFSLKCYQLSCGISQRIGSSGVGRRWPGVQRPTNVGAPVKWRDKRSTTLDCCFLHDFSVRILAVNTNASSREIRLNRPLFKYSSDIIVRRARYFYVGNRL